MSKQTDHSECKTMLDHEYHMHRKSRMAQCRKCGFKIIAIEQWQNASDGSSIMFSLCNIVESDYD